MLDVFFYPIINSTGKNNPKISIPIKILIYLFWIVLIYIPLCFVIHTIEQRENKKIAESSTYANLGLWCYLVTIILFLAYILLKVYNYTQNINGCNNFILLGYFFFIFFIFSYFILYCIHMSKYLNPKIYQTNDEDPFYKDIKSNHIFFTIVFTILNLSIFFQFILLVSLFYKPLSKILNTLKLNINNFSNLRFQNEK